ncbi:MAG: prepilin-type N-terminal cleavage/methylation domain-containing protein [Desulfocapsaceae bacterium]|nr:prepilin-type N-terminal cleavage/methylation domain-containing protein [Desulfocapsaceae bacterium]
MNKSAQRSSGFTLLEILMAISIFAIVVSLAYGSYRATFLIIDTTESQTEIYNKASIAMDRISSDLGSLYLGTSGFLQGKTQNIGNKEADTIRFTSTAHLILNKNEQAAGYATISYTVEEDPETKTLRLFRLDKAFLPIESDEPDTKRGLLLCDGLEEVQIIYHLSQGEQRDNWDSKEIQKSDSNAPKLPDRIEISLLFMGQDEEAQPIRFTTAVTFPGTVPREEMP